MVLWRHKFKLKPRQNSGASFALHITGLFSVYFDYFSIFWYFDISVYFDKAIYLSLNRNLELITDHTGSYVDVAGLHFKIKCKRLKF